MQIRTRLTIQFALWVCAILLIAFLSIFLVIRYHNQQEFYNRLREKALTSAVLLLEVQQVDSTLLKTIDLSKKDVLFQENISVYDENKNEIYTNNDSIDFQLNDNLFNALKNGNEEVFMQDDFSIVGIPFSYNNHKNVILAGAIDVDGNNNLKRLSKLLIALFLLMTVIIFSIGWIYAGRAMKPIKKVISEIQGLSSINLHQRIEPRTNKDEIGKLVTIFNGLLDRIENSFNLQKSFVSNVSHELKNPLTKITSQLEVTLLNERSPEEYRQLVSSVLEDIRELNQLSNSLLDLAMVSQDNKIFSMSWIRIDEILWEVRDRVISLNPQFRISFHTLDMPEEEKELYIQGNPHLLKTAFQNLIENACKYSDDQTATISLLCSGGSIEIRIFDNGPGIAENELTNIFQPFYRIQSTSQVKGYGIGLSLSQRILNIHNGHIEIESTPGQGTQISIHFNQLKHF